MNKILFIFPTLHCGGADRVALTYAKKLRKDGFLIKIIDIGRNEGELFESINDIFPLTTLGHSSVSSSFVSLFRLFKKEKPDFVFSTRGHTSVLILFLSIFFNDVKVIVRVPTMPSNKLYFNYKSKIISMFLTILYKRAYKIIAQTEEMETEIIDSYKVKKGKVFTITNPVDKDLIASKLKNLNYPFPERNVINYVAVGNVHFAKGYDTLIKAFKKLTEDISNVHLYIIGRDDSEYSRYLKKMVIDIHLESKIHFLGFESNPYVYMKFCDAYVLSSRMEGLPNALLEAAYLNKPIVTTKCVPIVERIVKEAINGYIVDVDNIEQMHFALINVLKIHNIKNQIQDSSENLKSIFS